MIYINLNILNTKGSKIMKILVLNCGSSSLKYQLINMDNEEVMAKGVYERIGQPNSVITHKVNGEKYIIQKGVDNHEQALNIIIEQLLHNAYGVISSLSEIDAVGHRVVHGGEIFNKSVLIDDEVISKIEECSVLAPLHNPAAIIGINACKKIMPGVKMSAVFPEYPLCFLLWHPEAKFSQESLVKAKFYAVSD